MEKDAAAGVERLFRFRGAQSRGHGVGLHGVRLSGLRVSHFLYLACYLALPGFNHGEHESRAWHKFHMNSLGACCMVADVRRLTVLHGVRANYVLPMLALSLKVLWA